MHVLIALSPIPVTRLEQIFRISIGDANFASELNTFLSKLNSTMIARWSMSNGCLANASHNNSFTVSDTSAGEILLRIWSYVASNSQEGVQESHPMFFSSLYIFPAHPVDMLPNETYSLLLCKYFNLQYYTYIPLAFSKSTVLIESFSVGLHLSNSEEG